MVYELVTRGILAYGINPDVSYNYWPYHVLTQFHITLHLNSWAMLANLRDSVFLGTY